MSEHKPGDVVKGKIARFANFGAFVELDDNLEGLCHISELSEERVEKPEDVVQLGQELEFKILRIDAENKKIGLSARAVGKDHEPVVDTKVYSSQAGSGMASLGELADFGLGKSAAAAVAEPAPEAAAPAPELAPEPNTAPESDASPQEAAEPDTAPEPEAMTSSETEPAREPEAKEQPAPVREPDPEPEAVREPTPEEEQK
jgi:small subunit ribosomal protein S1